MRVGVSHVALDVPSYDRSTSNPHLSNTLDMQPRVVEALLEDGLKVYDLPSQFAPYLSSLKRPRFWGQVKESASGLRLWGALMQSHGIRVNATMLTRFTDMKSQWRAAFNTTDTKQFGKIAFWLEGMVEMFEVANLPQDNRIVVHLGSKIETRTWSKKLFLKRFHSLPADLQQRLALRNCSLFSVQDCIDIHRETGIPVAADFGKDLAQAKELIADVVKSWVFHTPLLYVTEPTPLLVEVVHNVCKVHECDVLLYGKSGVAHARALHRMVNMSS